jgi:hypothetical protein
MAPSNAVSSSLFSAAEHAREAQQVEKFENGLLLKSCDRIFRGKLIFENLRSLSALLDQYVCRSVGASATPRAIQVCIFLPPLRMYAWMN